MKKLLLKLKKRIQKNKFFSFLFFVALFCLLCPWTVVEYPLRKEKTITFNFLRKFPVLQIVTKNGKLQILAIFNNLIGYQNLDGIKHFFLFGRDMWTNELDVLEGLANA